MDGRADDRPVLRGAEQVLYGRLMRGFPGHVVLAHVALSRLLATSAEDPVRHSVADFLLCRADFTPLAVFDLAPGSGAAGPTGRLEARRDLLLRAAGIKVIRLCARDLPQEAALRALAAALPLESVPANRLLRVS